MPKVLFDANHISREELEGHKELIQDILSKRLRHPEIKKLSNVSYQSKPVYRAKIDKKNRLIFCYIQHQEQQTPLFLAINNHNYGKVKRQLSVFNAESRNPVELGEDDEKIIARDSTETIAFLPTVPYNQMTLVLDDSQQLALQQRTPLILTGPPGAGKTAMLYNIMLRALKNMPAESELATPNGPESPSLRSKPPSVLFISQSEHLVKSLSTTYHSLPQNAATTVFFTTWQGLMKQHHSDRTLVSQQTFSRWLKKYFPGQATDVVHYELSLIAALGQESYQKLGARQCYYANDIKQKQQLILLLPLWQDYLDAHKLVDPMVTSPGATLEPLYDSVFCDEAQNLPPTALLYLINQARNQRFIACLDSEQCLISSPYIHSCLKLLLHHHYGNYSEHPLPRTWRCRPKVTETANHLMDAKYQLDGKRQRRAYHAIESAHASGGIVSWINNNGLDRIHPYGALADTVVIAEQLAAGDRAFINKQLGTNNILSAREAIGLDFDVVILWKPVSQQSCLHPLYHTSKSVNLKRLSLEQLNALNAIYVALTRAQSSVFIYETAKNAISLGVKLFGSLPGNQLSPHPVKKLSDNEQVKWHKAVEHHLAEGRESVAQGIMKFHLKMDDATIEEKLIAARPTQPQSHEFVKDTKAQADTQRSTKKISTLKKDTAAKLSLTEATQKIDKPSAIERYIDQFLTRISEQNLINLLEHPKALNILFKTQLADGNCLFTRLLVDIKWYKPLLSHMLRFVDSLGKGFTPEFLYQSFATNSSTSPLFWLASSIEGLKILQILFQKNPELAKKISTEALFLSPESKTGPPIHALAGNDLGREILSDLLDQNPFLSKAITATMLCHPQLRICTNISPGQCNTSVLYLLTLSSKGRTVLKKLLDQNPELAGSISAESLCEVHDSFPPPLTNTSVLFFLSREAEGQAILNGLINKNPELAKKISPEVLFLVPNPNGILNEPPFRLLSCTTEGQAVLRRVLNENPGWAQETYSQTLRIESFIRPSERGIFSHPARTPANLKFDSAFSNLKK